MIVLSDNRSSAYHKREELFRHGLSDRMEAGARSAGKDDSFTVFIVSWKDRSRIHNAIWNPAIRVEPRIHLVRRLKIEVVFGVQTTANLWDQLCQELESNRSVLTVEKLRLAAKQFKETATQVFRNGSRRHCDALEIAGDVSQETGDFREAAGDFEEALSENLQAGHISAASRIATKLALLFDQQEDVENARKYYLRRSSYSNPGATTRSTACC